MRISKEQREFLSSHRLCVFGFNCRSGPPSLSPVYYFMDGDEIVISTTDSRVKAKAVQRNPEVSVCVLDEKRRSRISRSAGTLALKKMVLST